MRTVTKMGEPKKDSKSSMKRPMVVTVISLLIDLIGFTIILPLFPSILQYYKEHDESGTYAQFAQLSQKLGTLIGAPANQSETVLMGGILGSLFSLLQFVSAPILGAFSDIYGRKKALLICLVGIMASHLLWLVAASFPIFILSRIVGGLSRANVSISTTIVSDDCPAEMRPKGMALIGIAFSVGFVVGPSIGAYFARSGNYSIPAIACFCLTALSFIIVSLYLDETLHPKYAKESKGFDLSKVSSYIWPPYLFSFKSVSVGEQLRPIGYAYFLYIFIYSGLEFTLTFLTQSKFQFTSMEQGKMFTILGITMAILQGSVTRRLKTDMEASAAMMGVIFMMPAFFVLGFCNDLTTLAFGLFCYSIGSAICGPTLTSIATSRVPKMNERGTALGIFRSLGALARGVGPIVASSLFWCFGPTVAYSIGAVAMLVPLFVLHKAVNGRSDAATSSKTKIQ
ncbi:major facilitator superfamily domain-containing protein 10 isoform X1 [Folsomia candida]|uniref:major facilitator superfamily domain-containing protein 10 isoform X1 n=1 Tax=Folsomia candida TaxID=158441 RepID=UPI000B8FC1A1|nr:major facilitator superfamily domain-containing protein 10 isoform X1 [Folsomia candida]